MRLSNEWFTALSENESGQLVTVSGRDELTEFIQSGKFKERVEITWKYEGDDKGERIWVYYTRTVRVFGERLNEALAPFEMLPISIYTEVDPDWEAYLDMYEMKEWAIE